VPDVAVDELGRDGGAQDGTLNSRAGPTPRCLYRSRPRREKALGTQVEDRGLRRGEDQLRGDGAFDGVSASGVKPETLTPRVVLSAEEV